MLAQVLVPHNAIPSRLGPFSFTKYKGANTAKRNEETEEYVPRERIRQNLRRKKKYIYIIDIRNIPVRAFKAMVTKVTELRRMDEHSDIKIISAKKKSWN